MTRTRWTKVPLPSDYDPHRVAFQAMRGECVANVMGGAWAVVDAKGDETVGDAPTDAKARRAALRWLDRVCPRR